MPRREKTEDDLSERLRPVVMRELKWLAATVLVLGQATASGVAIHTLRPATGLLIVVPIAVILYPLNMFARFSRIETEATSDPREPVEAHREEHWINRHPVASMSVITLASDVLVLVWGVLRS